jgi:hypothetical protein
METKFIESYKIYKAKPDGSGAASQFEFSKDKGCVFFEIAAQLPTKDENGNATFNWKKKLVFKLGVTDMGELLSVLDGVKNGAGPKEKDNDKYKGLFHSNKDGNAVLKFEKGMYAGYYIGLSVKKGTDASINFKHAISDGEAVVLSILLTEAIKGLFDWHVRQPGQPHPVL